MPLCYQMLETEASREDERGAFNQTHERRDYVFGVPRHLYPYAPA